MPNIPVDIPSEWTQPPSSTGTLDDQDEPDDEREDENEVPVGAPSDLMEAPEEFVNTDVERDRPDPDDTSE